MTPKFDISKIADSKWIGFVFAAGAAVAAFVGSLQEREQARQIEEYGERISKLEELLKDK